MEDLLAPVTLSLPSLQSNMKDDPEGYEPTLILLYKQFNSLLEIFNQNNGITFTTTDPTFAQNLGNKAMFLAHVTPFYPNHLADFPTKLADLLSNKASDLPSRLRCNLARALALLVNRKIVDVGETLWLFTKLQTLGDKHLLKLAFDHVVHSIRRMNKEHKNNTRNRALQNILFDMLREDKGSDEKLAMRALVTLCVLHKRKVWFDETTANEICAASFHSSSRIMIAALSFLLDYEKIENNDDDASSDDDELTASPKVILSTATVYKANHQGTSASKKKKKAKLQRVIRSMKRQKNMSSETGNSCYYSPLYHLKDAHSFAKKLLSRLRKKCGEPLKVKMMMMKLIARTVGLHRLTLIKFYPFIQRYIWPHQPHITNLLAMVVQACHDMVPPNAVEPLFKQIVDQFVHDGSRPEAITIGLSTVREICMRMPLLMNKDLLEDLTKYKKSHEKSASVAARSLISLFREVCPSLLVKKDRGRPIDPKARPKAYGEVSVAIAVPGADLLQIVDNDDEPEGDDYDDDDTGGVDDDDTEDTDVISEDEAEGSFDYETGISDVVEDMENDLEEDNVLHVSGDDGSVETKSAPKRKFAEFNGQFVAADSSLRALKKLAGAAIVHDLSECEDGFLSNEDFQRIKELKAKGEARKALACHGLAKSAAVKVLDSDQLCLKRVDGTMLETHVRKKLSKDEKLALVRAGREDRGQYHARTAVKQKKMGGLSNRQKEGKKKMPLSAKRNSIKRIQMQKKKNHKHSGKQFCGRKVWK